MEIRIMATEDRLVTLDVWQADEALWAATVVDTALDPSEWGGDVSGTAATMLAEVA